MQVLSFRHRQPLDHILIISEELPAISDLPRRISSRLIEQAQKYILAFVLLITFIIIATAS
jgi:hypothetical protein